MDYKRRFREHLRFVMTGIGGLAKTNVVETHSVQETLSLDRGEEVEKETCTLTFLWYIWPLVHCRGKYTVTHWGPALICLPWQATLVDVFKNIPVELN